MQVLKYIYLQIVTYVLYTPMTTKCWEQPVNHLSYSHRVEIS